MFLIRKRNSLFRQVHGWFGRDPSPCLLPPPRGLLANTVVDETLGPLQPHFRRLAHSSRSYCLFLSYAYGIIIATAVPVHTCLHTHVLVTCIHPLSYIWLNRLKWPFLEVKTERMTAISYGLPNVREHCSQRPTLSWAGGL